VSIRVVCEECGGRPALTCAHDLAQHIGHAVVLTEGGGRPVTYTGRLKTVDHRHREATFDAGETLDEVRMPGDRALGGRVKPLEIIINTEEFRDRPGWPSYQYAVRGLMNDGLDFVERWTGRPAGRWADPPVDGLTGIWR
jgi:hypothetical protein